jgi:hypothetical protein
MTRLVQPELLDTLPPTDPRALQSRRDLRRVNALMGNAGAIISFVTRYLAIRGIQAPITIAEIGAGEGLIAVHLAHALAREGHSGKLLLVDQQPSVPPAVGSWEAHMIKGDVFAWLDDAPRLDVIIANLFLHHFDDAPLGNLLSRCAELCDCFAAAEPRRSALAAWFSRRVKLIGCNDVTRHDAEISVRAGFNDSDLSALWPRAEHWLLTEKRVGAFTHFFGATRAA